MADEHPDLFAPASAGPPPGTIDGPPNWFKGFGAGLRCWCSDKIGWRNFGELVRDGQWSPIMHQHGRLTVALVFDLGPHKFPRPRHAEQREEAEA